LTPALIEHVHGRDLDVAVLTDGPDGGGLPASLDCTHLLDEHLVLAVGRSHRFASRRAVFLREVIGDTFVTGSDTDENALLRAHRLDDFRPLSQIVVAGWSPAGSGNSPASRRASASRWSPSWSPGRCPRAWRCSSCATSRLRIVASLPSLTPGDSRASLRGCSSASQSKPHATDLAV
jgi:DNA-binding transcriptional LysR family regulator